VRSGKGWRTLLRTALVAAICASGFSSACGTRAIVIPPGEPVRLRQTVKRVKVWAADAKGKEIPAVVDLPEGWWALPDPGK